jgi:DNA end-binding protein Ku
MPHAFWRGSISFGLVEIGVSLRPATGGEDLAFTLLDRKDFSPVGNRRYNKSTGEEVPWDRIVRGYEYEPEHYVVLTDEEIKAANFEATQTIDLVEFVERDAIDPIYFDTPYYVDPRGRTSRSYELLRKALEETGLVGIARVVLRTRQHVAAVMSRDGQLLLVLLRYQEELRDAQPAQEPDETEELARGKGKTAAKPKTKTKATKITPPSAAELRMATRLIEEMKEPWKPEEFKDEYRDDVLALIEKKVRSGRTHEVVVETAPRAEKKPKEVVDLMPLLKESLERRGPKPARRKTRGREREEAPQHSRRRRRA